MTKAELNRAIAREICGQVDKKFTNPLGDKLIHWYNAAGEYIGLGPEPPGNWSRHITEAMQLLARHHWTLHTCDMGYRCQIHEMPERGEQLLGDGVADSPMEAICIAAIAAQQLTSLRAQLAKGGGE